MRVPKDECIEVNGVMRVPWDAMERHHSEVEAADFCEYTDGETWSGDDEIGMDLRDYERWLRQL